MLRSQQRQRFVVLLFHCRKQVCSERFHLLANFRGLRHEQLKSHKRQRLVQSADDRADVESRRGGSHEQCRIDRRIEQGQPLKNSLQIQTVVNLEQPVRHRVPILQESIVARYAEMQRVPDAGQDLRSVQCRSGPHGRRHIKRYVHFHIDQCVSEGIERAPQIPVRGRLHRPFVRHGPRLGP